jgi:hypothetical protein
MYSHERPRPPFGHHLHDFPSKHFIEFVEEKEPRPSADTFYDAKAAVLFTSDISIPDSSMCCYDL